ncbi:hypothetical protein ACFCZ1_30060 [Streptomyces sp. NPDC056224]|uniref:hypothetical protein n=1 Tax=Streptomyces sp. NPDC056224 TaxID=3345750 RepID=UPI0035D9DE5F
MRSPHNLAIFETPHGAEIICGSQVCALDDGATSIAITLSALGNPPDLVPVNQSFRETAVRLPQVVLLARHPETSE